MTFEKFYDEYCIPEQKDPKAPTALDKFTEIMQACFDRSENLEEVVICGYTPSWNDGDPCRHTKIIGYTLKNQIYYDDRDGYFIFDDPEHMEEQEGWKWDNDPRLLNEKTSALIWAQNLDDQIWDTNYKVTIQRTDSGEIEITKENYYCGY